MHGVLALEKQARQLAEDSDMPLELLDNMALPIGRRRLYFDYIDAIADGHLRFLGEARKMAWRFGFTRLTNAFSEKLENHIAAIALHFMYYNFVRNPPDPSHDILGLSRT